MDAGCDCDFSGFGGGHYADGLNRSPAALASGDDLTVFVR